MLSLGSTDKKKKKIGNAWELLKFIYKTSEYIFFFKFKLAFFEGRNLDFFCAGGVKSQYVGPSYENALFWRTIMDLRKKKTNCDQLRYSLEIRN
jgi:hypothetical protein